jgi:hypothetical protein
MEKAAAEKAPMENGPAHANLPSFIPPRVTPAALTGRDAEGH